MSAHKISKATAWRRDWVSALEMARAGMTAVQIAQRLGRPFDQVIRKFRHEGVPIVSGVTRKRRAAREGDILTGHVKVSPAQEAEREARREASYRRTQTQEAFGDPPPGFSALDLKRQEARPASAP